MEIRQKTNKIQFQLGREKYHSGRYDIGVQIGPGALPVKLDHTTEGLLFKMCASVNIAFFAVEMTNFEVDSNLVEIWA